MYPTQSWRAGWRYAASAAGIALTTLALAGFFSYFHQANVAIVYLLAVLISATMLGMGPAILASLLAFLAFNFFFVPPLHTFTVTDPQDVVRLLTFFVVAVVTSSTAGYARAQADIAARSATELAALYGLSQTVSAEVALDRILPLVAQTTMHLLNVPACSVWLYDGEGRLVERASAGVSSAEPARRSDTFLKVGPRVLGVLRVAGRSPHAPLTRTEQDLLKTIAAQVVLVLERAQLVEDVSRAQTSAAAERVKGALLSSVSHDLRTPLAVIKGAATDLLDDTVSRDSDARRELLHAINDEADRLNRLVGNLLEMSRIESGALQPERMWQDMGELIADVVGRMQAHLAGRRLAVEIPDNLPLAQFSYTQIDQVLTNLLENAVKYTPATSAISISARADGGNIEVSVRDHGPGIPEGMGARIFEKFVRAVGPERHAHGTGLGLAICKGIVEAHGGQIWAANAPGGGAQFCFTLPVSPYPVDVGPDGRTGHQALHEELR